jgi:hypothetical protein
MATQRIKHTGRRGPGRPPKKQVEALKNAASESRTVLKDFSYSSLILVLMALLLAFGIYLVFRQPVTSPGDATALVQTENEITYQGVPNRTALELLKENAEVETQTFEGLGELVVSINGQASTNDRFWVFYINGEPAQEGAGSYVTKSSDTLSWRYEEARP